MIRIVDGVPIGSVSPAIYPIRLECNILVPMRDGVLLAMDLLRPQAPDAFPVVLLRTPYDKVSERHSVSFYEDLARRGYIMALQDCRGRYNSDGEFEPYRQEHADGFDTIEWLERQPWCDGNVGMIGGSYKGQTQWFAASQAPRALKAIVPAVSPPGHPFLNEPFYGGALLLAMTEWMVAMGRRTAQADLWEMFSKEQPYFEALPLSRLAPVAGVSAGYWAEWLSHPTYDEYWRSCGYEEFWPRMRVPALNISGWWDMNFLGAPRNFVGMREQAATQEAREGQRLVIGPWPHWVNRSCRLSGVDFGGSAITGLDAYKTRFLDYWLKGAKDNGLSAEPRVHVFVIGANEWWESNEWPLPGTRHCEIYLHSGGKANTHRGDGHLSRDPATQEPFDEYVSDPLDPVRSSWSLHDGPVDDRPLTARSDVLCYTSDVQTTPLHVVGPVRAVLYASSSGRDCDWHVRLVDVDPDGCARFLCHGVLRARFRHGFERAHFLEPGRIERFDIDMTATGVCILPGHRVRLEICSSWFSRFDRNPQTDAQNWLSDVRHPVVARQRLYHDRKFPSYVLLPLVDRPAGR